MKSFLLTLVIWAGLFGPLWYVSHGQFFPPADWIGALVISFFVTLGIGGLRKAWRERGDLFRLTRAGGPLRDGKRIAIVGLIDAVEKSLTAPLSGRTCLAYDYEIGHIDQGSALNDGNMKNQTKSRTEVVDYAGYGLAPSVIRSEGKDIRLFAFPGLEGFPRSATKGLSLDHVRDYVAKTMFEQQSLISGIGDVNSLLADRSGSIRKDWRMTAHEDLDGSFFSEKILPVGAKACVIGRYSEKECGIVPEANVGGVRVIRGSREEALEFLRDKITGTWIAAVLFILVPGPALWGILTYAEHYNIRNGKESVVTEMKTLADEYRNAGYFDQAEALYKRSLAMKEKVLGTDHPEVAESLEDLARNYQERGQKAQADLLYKRAEIIRNSPKVPAKNK